MQFLRFISGFEVAILKICRSYLSYITWKLENNQGGIKRHWKVHNTTMGIVDMGHLIQAITEKKSEIWISGHVTTKPMVTWPPKVCHFVENSFSGKVAKFHKNPRTGKKVTRIYNVWGCCYPPPIITLGFTFTDGY